MLLVAQGGFWMEAQTTWSWTDCRLAYDPQRDPSINAVGWSEGQIWEPDFEAINVRGSYPDLSRQLRLLSFPDGSVFMTRRWNAKYSCAMDLAKIPYDVQTCSWFIFPAYSNGFVPHNATTH